MRPQDSGPYAVRRALALGAELGADQPVGINASVIMPGVWVCMPYVQEGLLKGLDRRCHNHTETWHAVVATEIPVVNCI